MARSSANEAAEDQDGGGHGISGSGAMVAAAAAAAGGAATYAVRRAMAHRDAGDQDDTGEQEEGAEGEEGGLGQKKDDLVEALSTKASDLKQAAGKLRPRRHGSTLSSVASSAWEAAWEHLQPVAGGAAESLGKTMAEKAPELARKELIPRFIEGFQRGR